uniref:ABC transporter domain-containing protein n=1 Tax=Pyramimonas obovata TaxID=1411642 RepID=A0A7S0N5E7_9CHLO|mmetsp:Transcript_19420/g.42493  ORF Transcript_19420/g.42493 Transcript_19420/m.42493 type:complete len:626 (+) Transcript_19420:127-2004(+)
MMELRWREIEFTVRDESGKVKPILKKVTGQALPEQLVGILGPSGSGKTSLLTLLAGRRPNGASSLQEVKGSVTFDGIPRSNQTKRKTGFVLQDDAFFGNLTVREALSIQALLRGATPDTVERTLAEMGLLKCADTIVGGFDVKGISGGERKRLSISMELVGQPKLLLLDEPTSGLDSTAAHSVMFRLRLLANAGTTVVCSIHQPSSQVFDLFSQVFLLAEGNTIYSGKPELVSGYFAGAGFHGRPGFSTSDFMLDLVSNFKLDADGNPNSPPAASSEETGEDRMKVATSRSFDNLSGLAAGEDQLDYLAKYHQKHASLHLESVGATGMNLDIDSGKEEVKWPTSWLQQFIALGKRAAIQKRGDFTAGYQLVQVLLLSVISNAIWWRLPRNDQYTIEKTGYLFFTAVFFGFFSLFNALTTFLPELMIIKRERSSGLYRLSAYFWSKTLSELPVELAYPTLFTVCTYWTLDLEPSGFIPFLFYLWLVVLAATSWGLLIGGYGGNFKFSLTTASVIMLAIMLTGGFYVKKENIPTGLEWLNVLSFVTYGYNLLARTQFIQSTTYDCTMSVGSPVETCQTGAATFKSSDHVDLFALNVSVVENLLPLVIMTVVLRVAAYLMLRMRGAKI